MFDLIADAARGSGLGALAVSAVVAGVAPVGVALSSGSLLATASGLVHHASDGRLGHAYVLVAVIAALMLTGQAALGVRTHLGLVVGRRLSGQMLERAMAAASALPTVDRLSDPSVTARLARVRGLGSLEVLPGDGLTALVTVGRTGRATWPPPPCWPACGGGSGSAPPSCWAAPTWPSAVAIAPSSWGARTSPARSGGPPTCAMFSSPRRRPRRCASSA